jgi:catechol 2,3-dioxygenase
LGPVRLQVADLDRSIGYYGRVLGLRMTDRGNTTATLGAQNDSDPLVELRERRGATPVPRRGRLGLYHFALLLPDRAALGRLVAHLGGLNKGVNEVIKMFVTRLKLHWESFHSNRAHPVARPGTLVLS